MGQDASKQQRRQERFSVAARSNEVAASSRTSSELVNLNRKYDLSQLAVITVIFNPVGYKSRYEHYRRFESHMSQSNVYLLTVECIFSSAPQFGLPQQTFQITRANDPRHLQLVAPSILWIKENLINVAVRRLPEHVQYIAWLDADIEFERLTWPHLTIEALQRYAIVQLFELAFFLGPAGKSEILRRDYSFGYSIRHNKPINPRRLDQWYAHPGYAWAMRRSAFVAIGGLPDFCIIGSGDLHFAFALLNRIDETIRPGLHSGYRHIAMAWAEKVAHVAQNGNNVGYVPMNLYHHWHGQRSDRNYVDRWAILEKHQFSPLTDLETMNTNGLLRLANRQDATQPGMIARLAALESDIVAYFRSRHEDSNVSGTPGSHAAPKKRPPMTDKILSHRSHVTRAPGFSSGPPRGGPRVPLWTSGPSGTHVDDCNPYPHLCSCPGHHHCHENHECPCSPDHIDNQHCWDPSDNDHHHHHYEEQYGHEPPWTDNNTGDFDHHDSSEGAGGGFDGTDYGGHGSFY